MSHNAVGLFKWLSNYKSAIKGQYPEAIQYLANIWFGLCSWSVPKHSVPLLIYWVANKSVVTNKFV